MANIYPLAFKYPAWLKSDPVSLLVCHVPFPLALVLTTSQVTKSSSKRLAQLKDTGTKAECMSCVKQKLGFGFINLLENQALRSRIMSGSS